MPVVAGSEGAADESTPNCHHRTLLYYRHSVFSCAYNQSVMPKDALQLSAPKQTRCNLTKTNMHRVKTPGTGAEQTGTSFVRGFLLFISASSFSLVVLRVQKNSSTE